MKQRLKPHNETVKKIRTLRTHLDAHLSEKNDWKKDLGGGLKRRAVNQLLSSIFSIVIDCGKILEIRKLGCEALRSATTLLGERLIPALSEQLKAGKVGRQLVSVQGWEEDQELQQAEGSRQKLDFRHNETSLPAKWLSRLPRYRKCGKKLSTAASARIRRMMVSYQQVGMPLRGVRLRGGNRFSKIVGRLGETSLPETIPLL